MRLLSLVFSAVIVLVRSKRSGFLHLRDRTGKTMATGIQLPRPNTTRIILSLFKSRAFQEGIRVFSGFPTPTESFRVGSVFFFST